MATGPDGFFHIRKAFVVWFSATTGMVLMIAGLVLWWGLPRWVPDVVVTESPWFGPAFEAVVHGAKQDDLQDRLTAWEPAVRTRLLDIADSRADTKRRTLALGMLARCAPAPDLTPRLMLLLNDPDPGVSRHVLYALSTHKHSGLIEPLIDALPSLNQDDAWHAAHILAELPTPFALASTRLFDNPSTDMQMLGCIVLQGSPEPQAITALVERLGRYYGKRSHWDDTLDWAAFALGTNPQPTALDAIETVLADPEPRRRLSAAQALFWCHPQKDADRIRALVIRLATDPDPDIRAIALNRMSRYADAEVIAILQRAVADGGKPGLRAVRSLGFIANYRTPTALPALISALKQDDETIRTAVEREMRGAPITDRNHNAAIIALLDDPDARVRKGAARVVERLALTDEEQQAIAARRGSDEQP